MEKNILILTTVSGFLEKFEQEDVRILQRLGYTVHYASNMREQHYLFQERELEQMGVQPHHIEIERSPYMFRKNREAFAQLIDLIEKYQIQVIHCHTPVGGLLGRLAGKYYKKRNIKVIYTAHGFHFYKGAPLINNSIYYMVERVLSRYTDVIITINKEDYENARKFRLKPGGMVYRIPSVGLDMEHYSPLEEEERRKSRRELKVEDKFFLVSVGELNENKNHYIVLKALKKMQTMGMDLSKILYGICGEGFFHDRIEKWIEEMGLGENVILYGYQTDVRKILGSADCFVFPSKREGLGMAALEALSMGIPLVASDNRGTREYLKHMENGFRCDSTDEVSFIKGIEYIRNLSREKRAVMQRACRESVRKFEKSNTREIMECVYRGIE